MLSNISSQINIEEIMMTIDTSKIQHLVGTIVKQFEFRTETEGKMMGENYGISLTTNIDHENVLWLSFSKGNETHSVSIPLPFEVNGILYIQYNEILRAVCNFWVEKEQREIDYLSAIHTTALGVPTGIITVEAVKHIPFIQQIIYGFRNGNASIIVYRLQRCISELVSKMPLHETDLNSYVMNNRLVIIDEEFDEIGSPSDRLTYQVEKSRKYFDRGWTSLGLSDGTLADKNYILKMDLRTLSPFGMKYHNPQRNLYSTLGMKGDELPNIRSQSMQDLIDIGITRHGWNMFTLFADIPDIFEDQIMVDESHSDKFVTYERRYQLFGNLKVKVGTGLMTGSPLSTTDDGTNYNLDVVCDSAVVSKIVESSVSVGGELTKVHNVVVKYKRYFRDGLKLTNLHGNKGVIRLAKLGYAIDPISGKKRKIDVIVGAKTVGKRKNYGQVMEALMSCIAEKDNIEYPIVLDDKWAQEMDQVESGLKRRGFNEDGTWRCETYVGNIKGICGTIFWGCIKTPEDQVWEPGETVGRNNKEVRIAGLKFSHVEFRALETIFGEDNPVIDEVMSYLQGAENVNDIIMMLRSKKGEHPKNKSIVKYSDVKPVDQTYGTIVNPDLVDGTVLDEFFYPDGFIMELPLPFQVLITKDDEISHEGSHLVYDSMSDLAKSEIKHNYTTKHLYFPCGILRKCWRHATGKYGLNEIGVVVNNVVTMSHRLMADFNNPIRHRMYYTALNAYFNALARIMGTKRGEIATYTMAVRYPFSVKAVATLSTVLPKNTVEIPQHMADTLMVNDGDIVLAERFPCLGFMSVRPQKIRVTNDPMCEYVIRVSGNSLVSQNLDFDGDVLYLASFHTPEAKKALKREFENPNKTYYKEIKALNIRKGAPHIKEYTLQDMNISIFGDLSKEEHAVIVEKNTGVKAQTGPVIALTYNIMRLVEDSDLAKDHKMKVAIEMFLEKTAQSVFEQKHGGKSLYEVVIEAVCTADVNALVDVGYNRGTTEKLCELIVNRAEGIGVFDLKAYHKKAIEKGSSNIISTIVKKRNLIYFASRAQLEGIALLNHLDAPAVDIPSKMFKWATKAHRERKHTMLELMTLDKDLSKIYIENIREASRALLDVIDSMFEKKIYTFAKERSEAINNSVFDMKGGVLNYGKVYRGK